MGRTPTLALDPGEIRRALDRHVLDAWFPACLDHENGGFLCDFDARWRPDGAQVKMLEFQARQTRVAALGCRLHPGDPAWRRGVRAGLARAQGRTLGCGARRLVLVRRPCLDAGR